MNARTNSTASAPSVARLIALTSIGELALTHFHAGYVASSAKCRYHEAIAKHESKRDEQPYTRIDPRDPACAPVIAASKKQFDSYLAARRAAYNIKRRLGNACRKAVQP